MSLDDTLSMLLASLIFIMGFVLGNVFGLGKLIEKIRGNK